MTASRMDELKNKFLDLINKQGKNVKIPAMGFSDYFIQNVSNPSPSTSSSSSGATNQSMDQNSSAFNRNDGIKITHRLSDQEILEETEEIYFDENSNTSVYELQKFTAGSDFDCETIERAMIALKQQHKVISKKVLQLILEQRTACNEEFTRIGETEKMLDEAVWVCKKGRSYLNFAKKHLTTTSLEILATYKKRETLIDLLKILHTIKKMKSTDSHLQQLLAEGNYSGAISILLECRASASEHNQFKCVEALSQKLQDTLLMTEVQLDAVLNEMTQHFDTKKYSKLQEAYKLLGKTLIVMDQLHINFISTIHSVAFTVLRNFNDRNTDEKQQKMLFEQLCANIPADKYIPCLINLCKSFWTILSCYYQVILWHQNFNLYQHDESDTTTDAYIQDKLKNGQLRIWNDIQGKISVYLMSPKLHQLKYEQFIQVLSVMQKLKKVGVEFCGDISMKLMDSMKIQSIEFFKRYHASCLDEISLFLDNEIWVCVQSFTSVTQLQEYRSVKNAMERHKNVNSDQHQQDQIVRQSTPNGKGISKLTSTQATMTINPHQNNNGVIENDSSVHSQDGASSIYAFCGYFLRFSEKSTPFDGGFDESMLEEDILAGIADEASCYFSEESDDHNDDDLKNFVNNNDKKGKQMPTIKNDNDNKVDKSSKKEHDLDNDNNSIIVNNTTLTVLRCIGRYLQMCRLLHSITPQIVASMTELIDFYVFAVHELFAKDLPVTGDNLYSSILLKNLKRISDNIIPKVKNWPPPTSSSSMGFLQRELQDPETMYALTKRIVAVESSICLMQQFEQLHGYMLHLVPSLSERSTLDDFFHESSSYICDIRKPIYMCVTARYIDIQNILIAMSKVKWDINHVTVQHSSYIDGINRNIQTFAMRLGEISKQILIPKEAIWDSIAHVLTHTLVEGYSNAKKCSTGGRALMQLDFTHFMSLLELISGLKHQPHQIYVDAYVKAYYLPKDLLEEWIKEQKDRVDYSTKQLTGLVLCTCNNDKRTRQKLLSIIGNAGEVS